MILIIITNRVSKRMVGYRFRGMKRMIQKYRGKRLLTLPNLFRKIKRKRKRKKKGRKRVTQQAMQYFLPSKTSQQGWNEHRMVSGPRQIFPSYQLSACNKAEVAADRGPPVFRPCPQAFRRQQPFETRKRAIFHGLGEHGPRAACKYSRARALDSSVGRLNWHKDREAAVDRFAGSESARRGEIVNTLPLTYISRRDGTTAGYQPRKHQATE